MWGEAAQPQVHAMNDGSGSDVSTEPRMRTATCPEPQDKKTERGPAGVTKSLF